MIAAWCMAGEVAGRTTEISSGTQWPARSQKPRPAHRRALPSRRDALAEGADPCVTEYRCHRYNVSFAANNEDPRHAV